MGGNAQQAVDIMKEVDAPYLHPVLMSRRRIVGWEQSEQGLTSMEFMLAIMLPEFDGSVEATVVAGMGETTRNEEFDLELKDLELIPGRLDKFIRRVQKQLSLRTKPNKDKKIAIICYNYPPGESGLFGGAFLDTFASIERLLVALKERGYDVAPITKDELISVFTTDGLLNSARYFAPGEKMIKYNAAAYEKRIQDKPYYEKLVADWGDVPGNIMVSDDGNFYIPGIVLGNVFIGLQPARSGGAVDSHNYHDKKMTPHHQYLAFYQWLSHEFAADAMIHVGTHGTMEFTQGKESGMSDACFPDVLVADIPHMYLYYAGNPSEAMIAKRRSHANIISYQPTEYVVGDLYGEFVKINSLIEEYREAELLAPERCRDLLAAIEKTAREQNLSTNIDELEHELWRMGRTLIPKGLHTFGDAYTKEETKSYMRGLLRYDRGEFESLHRIVAEYMGLDYDELVEIGDTRKMQLVDQKAAEVTDNYLATGNIDKAVLGVVKERRRAIKTLQTAAEIAEAGRANFETECLFRALEAKYNPAKLAGDIYRNPEVLPSGYNVYQFDPYSVPSNTALVRGRKIAENTITAYQQEHGTCPRTTAVIIWGLEASRTHGETVAQVLAYWGVKKVGTSKMLESRYEIIPLAELGRPRVDVVINISGFFRDMFPNLMDDLSKLALKVASLDEPEEMNYVKANSRRIYDNRRAEGMSDENAHELSSARIFGPTAAEYGTDLTGIIATKNWAEEAELGEAFIDSIKYVYSINHRALEAKELYTDNLSSVELVSQIRSSHEYEVTDLDHYYEFFGGLAKSVELVKHEKVRIYITDTTAEHMETETADKAIGRGIRTRLLNPKWIDGILAHEYHGGREIADRFSNVMGLAATTGEVEAWIYDDMHRTYIADSEMVRRMKENNPYAYIDVIEQMMEYYRRGYWQATDEQIENLRKVYLDVDGDIEELIENDGRM